MTAQKLLENAMAVRLRYKRRYVTMLHEISFASYNGRDQVQGWIYVPACKSKGIVQVIHGFGEHSRRYLHMISAFLDAGYIVAADDHVGHGKTAMVNDVWGDWGDKGPHTMMEDEHTLKAIVCEKYPDLPYPGYYSFRKDRYQRSDGRSANGCG